MTENGLNLTHKADVAERSRGGVSENNCDEIPRLYIALGRVNERTNPRTARLLASGVPKMAQKVVEEAGEVAIEAVRHRPRAFIRESADLLFNLVVLWRECGVEPDHVWAEMNRRAKASGIAEKMPKRLESQRNEVQGIETPKPSKGRAG